MIEFTKLHGIGNDFVVFADLDNNYELTPDAARALCDRHFGIGSDGVIRIARGSNAPFFMDYRNPDGSFAEMCGNGIRTVGKWLGDRSMAEGTVEVETGDGVKVLTLHRDRSGLVSSVTVDMGQPRFDVPVIEKLTCDGESYEVSPVSMGNPHAVIFVDNVDDVTLENVGPSIQRNPRFPEGVNVEVVDVQPDGSLRQRTFERGAGETLACGTGACAVAVAAQRRGLAGEKVRIELRGGVLELAWHEGGNVFMTGPVIQIFTGAFDPVQVGIALRA